MVPQVLTADLVAAATRLAGAEPRRVRHGVLFRIAVIAADGKKATVTLQIDDHPKVARPYVLNDIADRLRVDRAAVHEVLADWDHEQLVAHLQTFTAAELKPPAFRR